MPARFPVPNARVAAVLLLLAFFVATPAGAQDWDRPVYDTSAGTFVTVAEMMDRLAMADVVHVGESHTDYAHHLAQLAVLEDLHGRNPRLVMGWEMFHSSQQPLLDSYTSGLLTENEWLDAIYWPQTWGHAYPYYKPLLDYAHAEGVRIFGLNAPRDVVRSVRVDGREGMSQDLAWWLPGGFWTRIDIPEETQYKDWFFEAARHGPDMTDEAMQGMFASQTAWNEVMGWNVVKAFNIIPDDRLQVLVIAGSGHMVFRSGIPTRVSVFKDGLSQLVVLPKTVEDVMAPAQIREESMDQEGDFLWFVRPAGDPPGLVEQLPPDGGLWLP